MELLSKLVTEFCGQVANEKIEVYNEFSLQHELGIWLRNRLPGYKVQFERPAGFFFSSLPKLCKKEIDISVFSKEQQDYRYAIELKYPRNGRHPETMFDFCKDLSFIEDLRHHGFSTAALLVFADDRLFYEGSDTGIFGFFRSGKPLCGCIEKPTGAKDDHVELRGSYRAEWKPIFGSLRYMLLGALPNRQA
jgi:hypothetical protein